MLGLHIRVDRDTTTQQSLGLLGHLSGLDLIREESLRNGAWKSRNSVEGSCHRWRRSGEVWTGL